MAAFDQPAASNKILRDAALNHFLSGKSSERAKEFGVTQRTINRWRASLEGKESQKRNPLAKASKFSKRKVTVRVKANYIVGGDPKYGRMRELTSNVPASFFSQALADPDEAWQTFLDANAYPDGLIDSVQSIRFK